MKTDSRLLLVLSELLDLSDLRQVLTRDPLLVRATRPLLSLPSPTLTFPGVPYERYPTIKDSAVVAQKKEGSRSNPHPSQV